MLMKQNAKKSDCAKRLFTPIHLICEVLKVEMKNETHDREVKFKDVLKLFKYLERYSLFRARAWTFPHLFDFLFVFWCF